MVDLEDATKGTAAIVSTPLGPPARFVEALRAASAGGRCVLDNSAPDDREPGLKARGAIWLTRLAERALCVKGELVSPGAHSIRP